MRKVTSYVYQFSELNDSQKQKAIEKLYDLNVMDDWYEFIYDDAKEVGLKIQGFDLDRFFIQGELTLSGCESANLILENHGKTCDTYKLADEFLTDYDKLVEKYSDGKVKCTVAEENIYDFDNEADDLEQEYTKSLKEEYLSMLRKEYEYKTSEEAIIESIEANEYEFDEEGNIA